MPIRRGQWRARRGAYCCLGWLGSIAAALILIIGFGLWRLMQGPIELDRLTPYVEEALNRSTDEVQVTLSGVRLAIDRDDHRLDLQLEGACRTRMASHSPRFPRCRRVSASARCCAEI